LDLQEIIAAARGEIPVELLLKNCQVVNLLSAEIMPTDIAVHGGKIVGFGDYAAEETIDLKGLYAAPGLIDGHVHLESSMLSPLEFIKAVIPFGTTTVIADPHEIVNVMGLAGLEYILDSTANLPLDVFVMLSSCVPATHLESSGAVVTAAEMANWIEHPRILGIAEMMNYPGVLFRDPQVLAKLALAGDKLIDGHAPLVRGRDLTAYIAAGISSDHESSELEEAREKLQKGMFLMIREGSAARNLAALLPLVTPLNSRNCGFVTDDRHPDFLMDYGHINTMVKAAMRAGIEPVPALQMASLNTARHFGLKNRGALAPGYLADIILFDNFQNFNIRYVFKNGKLVARDGKFTAPDQPVIKGATGKLQIKPLKADDIAVPAKAKKVVAIEIIPNQLLTRKSVCQLPVVDGKLISDPARDVLKMVVVERHHATGNIGLGFVKGLGLKSGAIASTVAHDSHNLIVVGVEDEDILKAIQAIQVMNGGQLILENGKVIASLPLPIAGLMSDRPLAQVRAAMDELNRAARRLGVKLENPFMTLSFLALPVIPEVKLTDKGLVDVTKFDFISIYAED
jgi:adenine deaminase